MKALATIHILYHLLSVVLAEGSLRNNNHKLETSTTKLKTFPEIKLSPQNEVIPFRGVDHTSGIAVVQLDYNVARSDKYRICLQADIHGFTPRVLSIHKGAIHLTVSTTAADFTSMLHDNEPFFDGCLGVDVELFDDIQNNPADFYVNAIIASSPKELTTLGIRGQIVQELSTTVVPSEQVLPFTGKVGASGVASIYFERAGKIACIDAAFDDIDPAVVELHKGEAGKKGTVMFDFSSKKLAPGRFHGCGTLDSLKAPGAPFDAIKTWTASEILKNPTGYYFHIHEVAEGRVGLRGQLDNV